MLSSVTGIIGNESQANYAAGHTFQDALPHHRVSKGLPSSSVDLGSVLSVGHVAESMDYMRCATAVLESLPEDEVHESLEYTGNSQAIDTSTCLQAPTQLLVGLGMEALYHQSGAVVPTFCANRFSLTFENILRLRRPLLNRASSVESHFLHPGIPWQAKVMSPST